MIKILVAILLLIFIASFFVFDLNTEKTVYKCTEYGEQYSVKNGIKYLSIDLDGKIVKCE